MLTKIFQFFNLLLLSLTVLFVCSYKHSYGEVVKADKSVFVQDYTWQSSNVGSRGILKYITLINKSDQTFNNINISVELYSRSGTPLGSVMGTIEGTISPGEVKTFEKVKLGLIHADVQKSIARVVGADPVKSPSDVLLKQIVLVKDWEWMGNQFGTDGILNNITIENTSGNNYKNIKLTVVNNIGKATDGKNRYVTTVVVRDLLLANSTSTYTNINVGFRHPDSTSVNIYVSSAEEIAGKELRYALQRKQKRDKQKKVVKEQSEDTSYQDESVSDEVTAASPRDQETDKLQDGDYVPSDDDVEIPKYDIQVKDFKWGSGIPGSQGIIRELTLKNTSNFAYSNIDLEVAFLSSTGVHLASNDFTLTEVLPPRSTKTYKNIKLGVIVILPSERNMRITVKDAATAKRVQ